MKKQINQLDVYNHCIVAGKSCDVTIEINPNLLGAENACLVSEMGWLGAIEFTYQPPYGFSEEKTPGESLLEYLNNYFSKLEIAPFANDSSLESNRDYVEQHLQKYIEIINESFDSGSISSGLVGREFIFRIDTLPHYVKQYRNDNDYTNYMRRLRDMSRCSRKYEFEYEIIDEELITSSIVADCKFKKSHVESKDHYRTIGCLSILGKFSKSNQQVLFNEDMKKEKEDCIKLIDAIIQAYAQPELDVTITIEHEGFRVIRKPLIQ